MNAIESCRREAEALRANRIQALEEFRVKEREFQKSYRLLEDAEDTLASKLNGLVHSYAERNLKPRDKMIYFRLYTNQSRGEAIKFAKSKLGFYKGGNIDAYYIQRAKSRYGYGTAKNFVDPLIISMEERMRKLNAAYASGSYKSPASNEECVGIEIEFISPTINRTLFDSFLRSKKIKGVYLHGDGSVSPDSDDDENDGESDYRGYEISYVGTLSKFEDEMKFICGYLDSLGAYVNKTCGLHVHLDVRNKNKEMVANKLSHALPYLALMNPRERVLRNSYCRFGVSGWERGERYYAINRQSFYKHKTIEVRLHSGTTNAEKIINWVKILQLVISPTSKFAGGYQSDYNSDTYEDEEEVKSILNSTSILEFIPKLGEITGELYTYILARAKKFN